MSLRLRMNTLIGVLVAVLIFTGVTVSAQDNAPELAAPGPYDTVMQTLTLVNPGVPDVPNIRTIPDALTDRALAVDMWMPARDDAPYLDEAPYPLIVISHGLNGDREQMAYLARHMATWGYVVAAIDHADPLSLFLSLPAATFYRPMDIRFVIDEIERQSAPGSGSLLAGLVDATRIGLIGYSYGGYGALIVGGAGLSAPVVTDTLLSPQGVNDRYSASHVTADPRVRAIFTFAPFGGDLSGINGLPPAWTADALAAITIPVYMIAGDDDEISGYTSGVVPIYEQIVNSDRILLTVPGAGHMIAQEMPPFVSDKPVPARMNAVAGHFAVAFFELYLHKNEDYRAYLVLDSSGTDWFGWSDTQVSDFTFRAEAAR